MYSRPHLILGVFPFEGRGLSQPLSLGEAVTYVVPEGRRAQLVYFRAGNSSAEIICATLLRNGVPMRLFPVGARADTHVSLAVIEDLLPQTRVEIALSAPKGATGELVLDLGIVEFPDEGD
jgi:hypothetical protein